jgi:hypothetical protein
MAIMCRGVEPNSLSPSDSKRAPAGVGPWARAVVQQDPAKITMIKAVTLMFAALKRSEEGH